MRSRFATHSTITCFISTGTEKNPVLGENRALLHILLTSKTALIHFNIMFFDYVSEKEGFTVKKFVNSDFVDLNVLFLKVR